MSKKNIYIHICMHMHTYVDTYTYICVYVCICIFLLKKGESGEYKQKQLNRTSRNTIILPFPLPFLFLTSNIV